MNGETTLLFEKRKRKQVFYDILTSILSTGFTQVQFD